MISLENVSKKYNGKLLLDHVCQSFDAGRSVAFMGHNVAAKALCLRSLPDWSSPRQAV